MASRADGAARDKIDIGLAEIGDGKIGDGERREPDTPALAFLPLMIAAWLRSIGYHEGWLGMSVALVVA